MAFVGVCKIFLLFAFEHLNASIFHENYSVVDLTLYRPYLYSYPIGIALFEKRLTSPLGQ